MMRACNSAVQIHGGYGYIGASSMSSGTCATRKLAEIGEEH